MTSPGDPTPERPDGGRSPLAVPVSEFRSRERESERQTRKPLDWWDRVKFLLGLSLLFVAFVWSVKANIPIISWGDAVVETIQTKWFLLVLLGLEAVRQIHYLISERSPGYHRFWSRRLFSGMTARAARMNDWNRFRLTRALKWVFFIVLLSVVMGAITHEPPATALFSLPRRIYQFSPYLLYALFIMSIAVLQFAAIFWFLSRGGVEVHMPEDIQTRFSDVKGQDRVLERVQENMIFLEDPESIEERGGYVPGGILLWGPPGTGKTLMAESVAGETGKPFVFVEPSAFINMFIGVGPLKVKSLFRKLRKLSLKHGGVICFFDEADSLGSRGAPGTGGGWGRNATGGSLETGPACNGLSYLPAQTASMLLRQKLQSRMPLDGDPLKPRRIFVGAGAGGGGGMGTLQVLLTELSGLKKPRGFFNRVVRRALGMRPKPPPKYRILVMMATNLPEALDEALLRPGRIDRIYKVGYPTKDGRKATFEYYLKKVEHELTPEQVDKLSTISRYATGATIKDMVNEGLVLAIRDGRESIGWADIIRAKQLKEHGLPEDVEYVERERHAVAVHEACHAVVAYRTRHDVLIDIATIEKRPEMLGMVSFIPPDDQFTHWRSERESDIMCSLASLAGERMFFDGDNSSGVSADLEHATAVTAWMEGYWGMGDTMASHGVSKFSLSGSRSGYGGEDGTDRTFLETELGRRVEVRLREHYERTWALLEANRFEVLAVAHALETHKTVSGDDVRAIIEGREGPLIDGRPYHQAGFRDLLEIYHAEAVAAHRGHQRLAASLPALVPVAVGAAPESGNVDSQVSGSG